MTVLSFFRRAAAPAPTPTFSTVEATPTGASITFSASNEAVLLAFMRQLQDAPVRQDARPALPAASRGGRSRWWYSILIALGAVGVVLLFAALHPWLFAAGYFAVVCGVIVAVLGTLIRMAAGLLRWWH
jgi:hypothetical protein